METNERRQRLTGEIECIKAKLDRLVRALDIKQRALNRAEQIPSPVTLKKWHH